MSASNSTDLDSNAEGLLGEEIVKIVLVQALGYTLKATRIMDERTEKGIGAFVGQVRALPLRARPGGRTRCQGRLAPPCAGGLPGGALPGASADDHRRSIAQRWVQSKREL